MFDVLTLWLVIWIVKNAVMDVSCAVTGKPNPRYELAKAKAKAAGQAVPAPPRYGTRDWLNDLVADGLQAQTDRRRRKAADKRTKREQAEREQAEREQAEREQDEAGEPQDDERPAAPQPAETPQRWGWTCRHEGCPGKGFDFDTQLEAAEGARVHLQRVHAGQPGPGAEVLGNKPDLSVVHDNDRTYVPGQAAPAGRAGTCRRCGAGFVDRSASSTDLCDDCAIAFRKAVAGLVPPQPSAAAAQTSGPGPGGAPGAEQQQPPGQTAPDGAVSTGTDDGKDVAPVIPINRDKPNRNGEPMSVPMQTRLGAQPCPRGCGGFLVKASWPASRTPESTAEWTDMVAGPGYTGPSRCLNCGHEPHNTIDSRLPESGDTEDRQAGRRRSMDAWHAMYPEFAGDGGNTTPNFMQVADRHTHQNTSNGGSMSTDVNAEIIGLDQSIAYATSLAVFAGEHGQAGNEGYIGHLSGQKVGGDALRTAAEMQEAFTNAQAAAEAHAAELEKQKQVQEAYDANPDAGDKQFQTEGR